MTFQQLNIIPPILKALAQEQYTIPTPIQEQAIPPAIAGRDLLGCAQTGTGKTAAFAVPILQRLSRFSPTSFTGQTAQPGLSQANRSPAQRSQPLRRIRALILTPTRELALQIYESFCVYGRYLNLRAAVIYGGVSQKPQEDALRHGDDILVATPGRLGDLMNQQLIDLKDIEILTLDEADRMLDMGFIHDVRKIIARTPEQKQTLFFSATMPPEIAALANSLLSDPVKIAIRPETPTVEAISQSLYFVDKVNKRHLLRHLLDNPAIVSALVFTRTKHGADRVVRDLIRDGIQAQAIHGNKSQNARQQALANFKNRQTRVLVATDIAARGIDIDDLSHVINYDLPDVPEQYVHRIGRTGRAGRAGIAISFCDTEERKLLRDIEKLCGRAVPVIRDHPYPPQLIAEPVNPAEPAVRLPQRSRSNRPAQPASNRPQRQPAALNRPAQAADPTVPQPQQPVRSGPVQLIRPKGK